MSLKSNSNINKNLYKINGIIDSSKEATNTELKSSLQEVGFKTVGATSNQPVMEYLNNIEAKHRNKIDQYKNYAMSLKERYQKYENESQRHYADVIKKH